MTEAPTTAEPDRPLLELVELRTSFDTARGLLRAVDGVSLKLADGESVGIVGESGSGKSIMARSIMNLLPREAIVDPNSQVLYRGRDARRLSREEALHFWGMEMGMVFQDPMTSLNPVRRIGAQMTDPLRFHLKLSRQEANERALELLTMVGIPEPRRRLGQFPHELSGGMRQRITIASALSCSPRLLIADEPTTALDVTVQKQILDLLATLQADLGMAIVLITHDLGVVANYTHRVAVMYAGQIVESASTVELFARVRHPYTEALLASIPRVEQEPHTTLSAIPGRPPDLVNLGDGCRFAPRCRYAQERCLQESPPLMGEADHVHRCFFPVGSAENAEAWETNLAAGQTAAGTEVSETSVSLMGVS